MSRLRILLSRLFGWFAGRQREASLRREIEAHIAEAVEELTARGMSPVEARRVALARFGDVAQAVESCLRRLRCSPSSRRDIRTYSPLMTFASVSPRSAPAKARLPVSIS